MSVFTWGLNSRGQLGMGDDLNLKCVWEPKLAVGLEGLNVVKVSAGEGHTLCVTEGGDLYAFGRGVEGQLGTKNRLNVPKATRVATMEHETVVDACCGALHSLAVTANGRVYQWGLVHKDAGGETGATETGQLVGRAQDPARNETLRKVLKWSTDKYVLAEEETASYFEELASIGYHLDDSGPGARKTAYEGMLRVQTKRAPLPIPELVTSLMRHKIATVAAGYAHSMAVSEDGRLFACGYNDRGQLGLGHRINTCDFVLVESLAHKFVLQVACGQQHNLARVAEGRLNTVGSSMGGDVYVWGNGTLGQLGIGRKGTHRGCLYPMLLKSLQETNPMGVCDVSAGGNFSVCICQNGEAFSWGHSEYNQHGAVYIAGQDYTDPFFYYVPRKIESLGDVKLERAVCGNQFTLAVTADGDLYSWGWNAYGVLGHGQGHYAQEPHRLRGVGGADRFVGAMSAGANHGICMCTSQGHAYAGFYRSLIDDTLYSDIRITVEGHARVFLAHSVVLSSRSTYFRGMLRAARSDTDVNKDNAGRLQLFLCGDLETPVTLQAILEYLYADRLSIPNHKRSELLSLSRSYGIDRLATLCGKSLSRDRKSVLSDCEVTPSTFVQDMTQAVNSPTFADVVFYVPDHIVLNEAEQPYKEMFAHKCILAKLPYFHTMFHGNFLEASASSQDHLQADGRMRLSIEGSLEDGISPSIFFKVLTFLYTGDMRIINESDSEDVMALLVAANRVGLTSLVQLCEKGLSTHLTDYPENAVNCYDFAQRFNVPRLERQCREMIAATAVGATEEKSSSV